MNVHRSKRPVNGCLGKRRDFALRCLARGISFVPIGPANGDDEKHPYAPLLPVVPDAKTGEPKPSWKPYQKAPPTEEEVRRWLRNPRVGIGAVAGAVSGNLELIDFDEETVFAPWCELVESACPGLLARLTVHRTPRPAFHVWYRCPSVTIPGNQTLAEEPRVDPAPGQSPTRVLIETRGEGGQGLTPACPPCCHKNNAPYTHHSGPALYEVAEITAEEREVLVAAACTFNVYSAEDASPKEAPTPPAGEGLRPGDDFNRRGPDWSEILDGWECVSGSEGGRRLWRRPGKAGRCWSATTGVCKGRDGTDRFYVFSSNAHPFVAGKAYSRFAAYAVLRHGGDYRAAARALAAAGYGDQQAAAPSPSSPTPGAEPQPVLVRLSAVQVRPMTYLWPRYLPLGCISYVQGGTASRKSLMLMDIIARISRGDPLPDDTRPDAFSGAANVLLLSAEDPLECVLAPRLVAAGADRARVLSMPAVRIGSETTFPFFPRHLAAIRKAVLAEAIRFVVIDPGMSYLDPDLDPNSDPQVRRFLGPLHLLAEELGFACVVVRHMNKAVNQTPIQRGGNSVAFAAASRAGHMVGWHPHEPGLSVLRPLKANFSDLPPPLAFRVEQVSVPGLRDPFPRLAWVGPISIEAEKLLDAPPGGGRHGASTPAAAPTPEQDDADFLAKLTALCAEYDNDPAKKGKKLSASAVSDQLSWQHSRGTAASERLIAKKLVAVIGSIQGGGKAIRPNPENPENLEAPGSPGRSRELGAGAPS